MGGTCSTHGKISAYRMFWGSLKGRDHAGDVGADGKKILKCILGK
jgi:hypothetical protein